MHTCLLFVIYGPESKSFRHREFLAIHFKIENLSEITEDIKKNQMEILELENIITKIKNSMDKLNSRMEGKEEKYQ